MTDLSLPKLLSEQTAHHPYPLLFMTVSGAHLYGFPSPNSDFDLRGVHTLPLWDMVGLEMGEETVERSVVREGLEVDLVTHDVRKFMLLLLKKNGYVLEQLYSPLVVFTTSEHEELKEIAKGCITRFHSYHYLGFARTQWRLFEKESPRRVKPLLYVYRVLLTGIHLMETGEVEANLVHLNERFRLSFLDDLIQQKVHGEEKGALRDANFEFHEQEVSRLTEALEAAHHASVLPERSSSKDALNNLLLRMRLSGFKST